MKKDTKIEGLDRLFDSLDRLNTQIQDLTPVMQEIGNTLQNSIEESFEKQQSPFGKKWKANKKIPKNNPQKRILIDSGRLQSSFTTNATDTQVSVGTNVIYAAIHNYGGKAGRGKKVKIPARPFMPVDSEGYLPDELIEDVLDLLDASLWN